MKKTNLLFTLIIATFTFNHSTSWSAVIIDDVNFDFDFSNCCLQYEIEDQTLNLSFWGWMASGFQIDGNNGAVGLVDSDQSEELLAMEEGELINNNGSYVTPSDFSPAYHSIMFGGTTMDEGDTKYFGFKILSGANTYFGWVSVTRTANGATINQIAYDNESGSAITTGNANSIEDNTILDNSELVVYPNPTTESISIDSFLHTGNASIFSSSGTLVKTYPISEENNSFDVSDLSSGIYSIKLNNQTMRFIKR